MPLAVTVLGSAGMYASLERAASGYLVEIDEKVLWLDAGGGTWRNLIAVADYRSLHGVLLTHRHPDHVIDVFQAFHARAYGDHEPLEPIPLWAPQETIDCLEGFSKDLTKAFDPIALDDGSVLEIGDASLAFTPMAHPADTLGVRLTLGETVFAYSADTGPGADFARLASNADLFICESTFQDRDGPWEGHLHASEAARIAQAVGAKKLLLSHLPHGRDLADSLHEAKAAGAVAVELAKDLDRHEVGA